MKKLKIILVDNNEVFRLTLKTLIAKEINAEIIGEASNAHQFLKIENLFNADLIFMDIMMPDLDGISLTKKILWEHPRLKIIAITLHVDKVYLVSLIEAGFMGCISKDKIYTELKLAIKTVTSGLMFFPEYLIVDKN